MSVIKSNITGNRGFTLVETLITVAILAILVSGYATFKLNTDIEELNQRLVHTMIEEITLIGNQAQAIYAETRQWPDYARQCVMSLDDSTMQAALPTLDYSSPIPAVTYSTQCTENEFSIYAVLPATLASWAHYVAAQMPSIYSATTLEDGRQQLVSRWTRPAEIVLFERLLEDYYKTDGSKPLTGNMNVNGHNLVGIGQATGEDFILKTRSHSLSKTTRRIQLVQAGDVINKPNCTNPKIYISPANIKYASGRPITSLQWTASSVGSTWVVKNTVSDDQTFQSGYKGALTGVAVVKCL